MVPNHNNNIQDEDLKVIELFSKSINILKKQIDEQKLDECIKLIWKNITEANKYIDTQAPWTLKDKNPERMSVILYTLIEFLRQAGIMLQPFIPDTAEKILDSLSININKRTFENIDDRIRPNIVINKPEVLFPRIDN